MEGDLKRHLGTTALTLYGVGVIVGAGIYVLVGKVAGVVGDAVWLGFVLAAVAALPTGLSYAELASRHPRSAGEAVFVERAFRQPWAAFLMGYFVLASGVASTAAVSHGFASYLGELLPIGDGPGYYLAIVAFLSLLSWVNHRGIEESTWLNMLCVVVSVGALVVLVAFSVPSWGSVDVFAVTVDASGSAAGAVVTAAALSFYAFIGFEDICNVAEEVERPQRTIPRAILLALAICTVIYAAVGISVVSVVPAETLAASDVPLADVARAAIPGLPPQWLSLVALFAVANTALFNLIMASRILYGMARAGWIPRAFGAVHEKRKTPTWSVVAVLLLAAVFALTGFLKVLAESTNVIILLVFFGVNLSLVVIRLRNVEPDDPAQGHFRVHLLVPIAGMLIAGYLATRFTAGAYLRAGGLLSFGALLYVVQRLASARRSRR